MADCFLKVRAHTEANPVFVKSNLLLKALDQTLPSKSPTLYYAAILHMVQHPEEQVHQEASVLLLACVLQATPVALIQSEFSSIKSSILSSLHKDSIILSKYSVKVLERLIQVITKEEWDQWSDKVKSFTLLSDLVLDSNENTKKQACSSLSKLLRKGLITVNNVKSYLIKTYTDLLEMQNRHVKSETLVNCLSFLSVFLQLIEMSEILSLADKIISMCMITTSTQVSTKAYLVLETLFAAVNLPRDVVVTYLNSLLANPVLAGGNEELQTAYLQCLTQGLTYFNKTDSLECYKMLAQGMSTISEFLLSNQFNVQHAACSALKSVIYRCITPSHAQELDPAQELLLSFDVLNIDDQGVKPIQKINAILVYLLNERFNDILEIIFPVLAVYSQQLGSSSVHIIQRIVIELDRIASRWCENKKFKKLIAAIIDTIGYTQFFSILQLKPHLTPLESPNFLEHSRSWLFQIINSEVETGDIRFFFEEFLPIFERLEVIQNDYLSQGLIVSGKKYSILISQLWSCFPTFCSMPSWPVNSQQLLQSKLPMLSKIMGKSSEIKTFVIIGLEKCLKPSTHSLFTQVEDKFVPLLFNNYLANPDKPILLFLKNFPMSSAYADKMCKRLIQKILEARQENKTKDSHLLMDLLIKITGKLVNIDPNDKDILAKFILAYIESTEGKVQKKAYRVLRSLVAVDQPLVERMLNSGEIKICSEVARKERLKVYHELLMKYSIEHVLLNLNKYLIEVMHCLKSQSHKARALCKCSLISISHKLFSQSMFMNLYNCVLGGMASNMAATKASSVEILKILIKEFAFGKEFSMFSSEEEQDSNVFNLNTVVILMLKDESKEVIRAALRFVKGTIPLLGKNSAGILCESVIKGVFAAFQTISGNLKHLVRYLIEKLVRKCGFEAVSNVFPAEHLDLLRYVYKLSKKKTKKVQKKEENDEDMEIDEEKFGNRKEKVEKHEEEPREYHFLNPLDVPVTQKKKKKIVKVEEYGMQGDKFVFNEEDDNSDDDDDGEKPKKKVKVAEGAYKTVKEKNKKKSFAFVQYSADILNKRKALKNSGKISNVVDKAKLGVLKGLKARKKKFS